VGLALHERYSSGFSQIPLRDYYLPYAADAGFTERTVRVAEFLVANRRTLKQFSKHGLNDEGVVSELVGICRDVQLLRSLFVFTCADRLTGMPDQEPGGQASAVAGMSRQQRSWWQRENSTVRWFNTKELYVKALAHFLPEFTPDAGRTLRAAGYGAREREILEDFGRDYFSGQYVRHTNHFAAHLLRLADDAAAGPKVALVRDGDAMLLGVAARDFRGLAACIAGALRKQNVSLSQAHLFSATRYHLALDFFHLALDQPLPHDLTAVVRESVQRQLHISEADAQYLPPLSGTTTLDGARSGVCCLHHETTSYTSGLLYALTYKVFRELGGSIHGLSAYTSRGCAYVAVHLTLPRERSLDEARETVRRRFGS
jgi:UTP:GlnB (protein PII) uridylyltransferase